MQTIGLTAIDNQDYRLTLDFSEWITAGYVLDATSSIVKIARLTPGGDMVMGWSNRSADRLPGVITLNATRLLFTMPVDLVRQRVAGGATLVYDVRLREAGGRTTDMFGGTLTFSQGVTR